METQHHASSWPVTAGIVLRTYPLTESSLIVRWITRDFGRINTVAKGARNPKSNLFGKLDLYYFVDFSFKRSRTSDLHTLKEAVVRESHPGIRTDLVRLELIVKAATIIEKHTEDATPLPGYYTLLRDYIACVQKAKSPEVTVAAYKIKFLAEYGLTPNIDSVDLSPAAKQILKHSLAFSWDSIECIKPTKTQFQEINLFLDRFIQENL